MNPQDLLLRDIHLPDPVSWWPPAIGWWLVGGLASAMIWSAAEWLRRRASRRRSPAAIAARELAALRSAWEQDGDAQRLLRDLSTWLRRAAMSLASREAVAGLTGDGWRRRLDEVAGARVFTGLSEADCRLLDAGPYRPGAQAAKPECDRLIAACDAWLAAAGRRQEIRP